MSQVISLVSLPSKFCSGTLEASLSRSLWRSSLGRNSLLSQTGLKSKQTPYLDELSFFLHIFNCLILKNILTTVSRSIGLKAARIARMEGMEGHARYFIVILTGHLCSCIPFHWWWLSSSFYDRLSPGRAMWGLRNTTLEKSLLFTHSNLKILFSKKKWSMWNACLNMTEKPFYDN